MRVRTRTFLTHALLPLLAAALAVVIGPVPTVRAAAYTYSAQERTVNAGILLVDDAGSNDFDSATNPGPGVSNPDPYIFYIFNQRSDIKPFGWNVVNPLAPTTVTGDILNRWNFRPANGGASSGYYQLNEPITPDMAPYWEVSLSKTSLDNLLQYDVLLLNIRNANVQFTDDEVHKLRRFVDAGGQLLIEGTGGTISATDSLFFNGSFNSSGSTVLPYVIPATNSILLRHPIIASPYLLSQQELDALGPTGASQIVASTSALLSTVLASGAFGTHPAVLAAGQYGAGQIVLDATGSLAVLNDSVLGINGGYGTGAGYNGASNSGPRCEGPFTAAPAANLKLLADILAWTGAHPNEHKNSHQSSQSPAVVGPALTSTWTYSQTTAGPGIPTGAAINGNFVYVRGADGVLRAFNATPGTDILGTGNPDAGFPDYTNGAPYDEIWSTGGDAFSAAAGAPRAFQFLYGSAPTVASYNGITYVFIEDSTGKVYQYNATDGSGGNVFTPPNVSGSYTANYPAPAPTFYDGRIYAGQPDGSLYVYDLAGGSRSAANPGVDIPFGATGQPVVASPTVGIVRQGLSGLPSGTNSYSDDIIAVVTTLGGVYTLELGSRHDPLLVNGPNTYRIHGAGQNAFYFDSVAPYNSYYFLAGSGYQSPAGGVPVPISPSTNGNTFTGITLGAMPYYGDYDVDFNYAYTQASSNQYVLNRSQFDFGGQVTAQSVSAPALASNGNFYYTINTGGTTGNTDSTLVCAHDTRTNGNPGAQIQWRFRLPYSNESVTDADGISYNQLEGYQFVGAPVVDRNNNVFALASRVGFGTTPNSTIVLCFNGTQRVTAQVAAAGQGSAQVTSLTQTIPNGTTDEFGGSPVPAISAQYTPNVDNNTGEITLLNFGTTSIAASTALVPNISEPQPVSVTYTVTGAASGGNPTPALLHTNMLWYALLAPTNPLPATNPLPTSGLTLVGNYLYYGDAQGDLIRVYAYPQNAGLVTNRVVQLYTTGTTPTTDSDGRPTVAITPTSIGPIGGVPSAGNNVMVVNGTGGVAAFGSQNTIVADANRVVELDADGVATWAVDATTRIGANNVATHLDLNHPSSINQLTSNDYLVADTGNNRCVRFDRSGNVLWELTRFNDVPLSIPAHTDPTTGAALPVLNVPALLAPGEPTTLSHPSSVNTYTDTSVPDTTNGGNYTIQHYLIADTGNYRVLDIVDVYNGAGTPVLQHDLYWISHTYDVQHRSYSYTSANYYYSYTSGLQYIAALVSNTRLASLTPAATAAPLANVAGNLGPATADAPGASLVLLDYDPYGRNAGNSATPQVNGYVGVGKDPNGNGNNVLRAFSRFTAVLNANNSFNLTYDNSGQPIGAAQPGTARTLYLRNPRFLQTYTNKSATSGLTHFLLADDNGVFDLIPNLSATPGVPPLLAVWGFTPADYSAVQTPIDATSLLAGIFDRTRIPFIPTSISRPSADIVGGHVIGHYLVTNGYSQGEVTPGVVLPGVATAAQPPSTFGGEVLELHAVGLGIIATTLQTQEIHQLGASFTGTTLSKPGNTSPLSQPAFAAREK